MQKMIQEYERTRAMLLSRIHEINAMLRDNSLMTHEREQLERRREMLTAETIDMLHVLVDLRRHA